MRSQRYWIRFHDGLRCDYFYYVSYSSGAVAKNNAKALLLSDHPIENTVASVYQTHQDTAEHNVLCHPLTSGPEVNKPVARFIIKKRKNGKVYAKSI